MPYDSKQRRLFNAAAHDPKIAREHGMSGGEATKLANEANKLKKKGEEKASSHFEDLSHIFNPAKR